MNLNELIAYYTAKLENPDLTLRSREIAEATQKWLYNVEVLGETVDYHKNRETVLRDELNKLIRENGLYKSADLLRMLADTNIIEENAKLKLELANATFDLENYVEATVKLNAEIAVKDMALADKNEECASLYLRLEEIERYHYDEARKRG